MINYNPLDSFTDSQIWDLSDLVIGGTLGASNVPIKALLDRTNYLYNRLWCFDSEVNISANTTIDNTVKAKVIRAKAGSNNIVVTLDALANFPTGFVIPIYAECVGKSVTIKATGSETIFMGTDYVENAVYMHDGEFVMLIRSNGYWLVLSCSGNFLTVGQPIAGYAVGKNQLIRMGQLIIRADYPRLTKWVMEKLVINESRVLESTWLSDPVINGVSQPMYRGCFSTGPGADPATNLQLRLPDDRGLFDRFLDLGRGLDNDRLHAYAGGLELDMNKAHKHASGTLPGKGNNFRSGSGIPKPMDFEDGRAGNRGFTEDEWTLSSGGIESRPKNVGKIPLLNF